VLRMSMNLVPQHVAIIMDGNGRWATARNMPRVAGHKQGAETVETIVRAAAEKGIRYLTLFAFSTENWRRPESEVTDLMGLLRIYLRTKTEEMHKNNVRIKVIGERYRLSGDILGLIEHAEKLTENNDGITVLMALSYSGRWDLTQAIKRIVDEQVPPHLITEELVGGYLQTANIPDPDLIIRTSGEQRISNFLLWQGAYSEYYFTDRYWPEFDAAELDRAIESYQQRDRRFGNVRSTAR
jgi:undecaprenyl diphosphate synthase